jgi:hypothetical protein
MPALEEQFKENLEAWRKYHLEHLHDSSPVTSLNCEAYRNIVSMGKEALPLIRKAYDSESSDPHDYKSLRYLLVHSVAEIVMEDFEIPEGHILETEDYTIKWLDENMSKYVREKK